ncbi:KdsC family phosphatase [Sulfurihydrogenibium subterraneum]|uniref:KdsC family phosphatase n=1 Tax=Sulfurihydrogenibium subterraneum TaxID=171121 RepID=UPI0004914497|nr:HAD-IIIA family hydrolase [Sulfurihydrogenibium subterraneum]
MLEEKAKKIKWFIFDVDGVLTDGKIIYDSEGREIKNFCVKDGIGIHMLHLSGIKTAIITGRNSEIVNKRAVELGITEVFQNSSNKLQHYKYIKEKYSLQDEEILYMGDDIVDIPVLKRVGFPATVPSAPEEVKKLCIYITKQEGGNGAVREVIDLVLKIQGKYKDIIKKYCNLE